MTQQADTWLTLGPCDYQADGFPRLQIPVHMVGEDGALRVVLRVRPWQPGAKLDETGPDPDTFTLESLFSPDVQEPGMEGITLWPDQLEELVRQFKSGRTATLNLPWKRQIRVKPVTWSRRASSLENRGGELLTVTLKTDNEDALDREAFERVSVKATAQRAAEEAVFALESEGMSPDAVISLRAAPIDTSIGDPLASLTELAAGLSGLLSAPSDFALSIATQAARVRRAIGIILGAYDTVLPGRNQMGGPDGASARLKLIELAELAAQAEAEARAALPKTRTYIAPRNTDIWLIATELRQSPRDLMTINSAIADFSFIPAGTPVTVFA